MECAVDLGQGAELAAVVEVEALRKAPVRRGDHGEERLDDVLLAHAFAALQQQEMDEHPARAGIHEGYDLRPGR